MPRGRPKKKLDELQIRQDLLTAAAKCLSEKSYALVSIRELANSAGSSSAMISYHFGGKQGLVQALLTSLFQDPALQEGLIPDLEAIPANQRTGQLVIAFLSMTHQHPWLLRMIIDDLVNQNPELRHLLASTVAGESNRLFEQYFDLQVRDGYFRADFERGLSKTSLLALLAFPFLATAILREAYQVDLQQIRKGQLVNHIVSTFEASLLRSPSTP